MTPSIVRVLFSLLAAQALAQPTSLFEFQSNRWVNLHHMLYMQARARLNLDSGSPERLRAESDTAGFGKLTDAERASWLAARDWYARSLARRNPTFDSLLIGIAKRLAAHANER